MNFETEIKFYESTKLYSTSYVLILKVIILQLMILSNIFDNEYNLALICQPVNFNRIFENENCKLLS